ncbi:hypothetical protein KIN20_033304 [Parelaphostrongylus tenuis]|uniref:Globin family profile domain-containing protein n=1 Tax=Parelaphostrongylus tenuis TaxID=148309 RepID=A0AAD5WIA5_PARTN|nr:hypothetical protein KIN20_033304 [Parelaphostrongylus tenuis]
MSLIFLTSSCVKGCQLHVMGNQSTRRSTTHRKHVVHSWNVLCKQNPALINDAISEAWLKAAELTPTWVWALVDLPETMHANYRENARFLHLIQQVRSFLHLLIKVHRCDAEMTKALAFRLGTRHKNYMNEGHDNSYWAPFAQQLPISIAKTYMDVVNHDSRIRRLFRVRVHGDRSEEEVLVDAWRQLMNTIVESMKRGYEGCASQKTPMRLSITNSIISMASLRSVRSRSAPHFLEPALSPVLAVCSNNSVRSSPPLHCRSRSIFRNRQASLGSRNYGSLRRRSSPNNGNSHCSKDLLQIADEHRIARDQRRSLTLTPNL